MAEQPLAEMVEIAVREFTSEADTALQQSSQSAEDDDTNPTGKRRRVEAKPSEAEEGEDNDNIQTLLYAASKTLCLRLDTIEAHLNSMEDKCKCLRAKVDMLANQNALRPLLAEQATAEVQRQAGGSSTGLQRKSCGSSGDPAEDPPAPKETGAAPEGCASQDLPEGQGEPSEGQPGVQALGPGVHIVALCADGGRGEGEERADGGAALLPDATNLLYQLMY